MNLLLWLVVGMIVGSAIQAAGRVRNEVAVIGGLCAGAAGAVAASAWATDLSMAMQLIGAPISEAGLLAAAFGAAVCSGLCRVLRPRRPHRLHASPRARPARCDSDLHASPRARRAATAVASCPLPLPLRERHADDDAREWPTAGDTEPAAFDGWRAQPQETAPPPANGLSAARST